MRTAGILDLFPLACRVRSYALLPLMFQPDGKNQYSNAGLNTAGRIVEVVSGTPFERFLDDRLFQPLAMKETAFWPSGDVLQRLAKSYEPGRGGLKECPSTTTRTCGRGGGRRKAASRASQVGPGGLLGFVKRILREVVMVGAAR